MHAFKIIPFKKYHKKQVLDILISSSHDHYKGHPDYFLSPEIGTKVLADFLEWILSKRKNFGLVAVCVKNSKEILGFVVCEKTSNLANKCQVRKCYIQDIAVRKENQGEGIGRALMRAVKEKALFEDIHQIELCVFNNVDVKSFYEKIGYKPIFTTLFMDI